MTDDDLRRLARRLDIHHDETSSTPLTDVDLWDAIIARLEWHENAGKDAHS